MGHHGAPPPGLPRFLRESGKLCLAPTPFPGKGELGRLTHQLSRYRYDAVGLAPEAVLV